jgi:uncharacterized cupin superfamily protein
MKPTAPFRNKFSMFAATPCRGLSLSRWMLSLLDDRSLVVTRSFVICSFLLGAIGCQRHDNVPGLVGTWQLVSRIDRDASGAVIPEPDLGSDPVGYLMYDAKGHVSAQLMARHRAGTSAATVTSEANSNNPAHIGGYDSYFGRYEVDRKTHTVTHILDGALSPADIGRRLTRQFELAGDTLTYTITFEPGTQASGKITRTIVWHRVSR